jgi:hypothetical protein
MNNVTEIRQLLKEIKTASGKEPKDIFYFLKADQALTLLPCETCTHKTEMDLCSQWATKRFPETT